MELMLNRLRHRQRRPEMMDQPELDPRAHRAALRGLERINFWSNSARILWKPIRILAREFSSRPLRLLDIATGAGDVPLRLWRRAQRAGMPLDVAGCDISPVSIEFARKRAEECQVPATFFTADVCRDELPGDYDVITSSLFLHHLDAEEAVLLLRGLARVARRLVLVSDLNRSRAGYLLAWMGTRLLSLSRVVHTDGPRSVEGAYTIPEAQALAERAGLTEASVEPRWPCRWLLVWRRQ
jgi:2-polyprenyl-3-methyl-5-hydroxy-6-metoxy-1,4-benzoquinol methylase